MTSKRANTGRRLNVRLLTISVAVLAAFAVIGALRYRRQQASVTEAMLTRGRALIKGGDFERGVGYLQRYLWLEPEDVDARLEIIDALQKKGPTFAERRRFGSILYQTIGIAPRRPELQRMLAENLWEMGSFDTAITEATKVLDSASNASSADRASARRVIALSSSMLAQEKKTSGAWKGSKSSSAAGPVNAIYLDDAAARLTASLKEFPNDRRLAVSAAEFYRGNGSALPESSQTADAIMDTLVKLNPSDADCLAARASYRMRYGIADSQPDAEAALRINPKQVDALLLSAAAATGTDAALAEARLNQAIDASPGDVRAYLALAELFRQKNKFEEAEQILRRADQRVGPHDILVAQALATVLVQGKNVAAAAKAVEALDQAIQQRSPEFTSESLRTCQNRAKLLKAQLATLEGRPNAAIEQLKGVIESFGEDNQGPHAPEVRTAKHMLAMLLGKLGAWDLAARAWDELDQSGTLSEEACLYAAEAHLRQFDYERATRYSQRYLDAVDREGKAAEPSASLIILQAAVAERLCGSSTDEQFLKAFSAVERRLQGRWEPALANATFLYAPSGKNSRDQAIKLLRESESQFENDAKFWRAWAFGYLQMQAGEDAERALARYCELEPDEFQRTLAKALFAAQKKDLKGADEALAKLAVTAHGEKLQQVQLLRIEVALAAQQANEALELISSLIDEMPKNPSLLVRGIDVALAARNFQAAEKWEEMLRASVGADDRWRERRAQRYLADAKNLSEDRKTELTKLIADLRDARPAWIVPAELAGRFADANNNRPEAIAAYQSAVSLGDANPAILERLIALLYAEARYAEAEAIVAKLPSAQASTPQLEALRISAAIQQHEPAKAAKEAEAAILARPDDPLPYLWLANALAADGKADGALEKLRDGIRRFPRDAQLRNGLFALLVRSGQTDEARQVLAELADQLYDAGPKRQFVLAQGFELLGDVSAALDHARQGTALDPQDVGVRMLLAKLLSASDAAGAQREFEEVLRLDPANAEAKRHLATLLALAQDEKGWRRAMKLIGADAGAGVADTAANSRLRAVLLSRKIDPKTGRPDIGSVAQARSILERKVRETGAHVEDLDRVLLSQVSEQEAWLRHENAASAATHAWSPEDLALLQQAREQLQELIGRPETPPSYMFQYAEFLLRVLAKTDPKDVSGYGDLWHDAADSFSQQLAASIENARTLSEKLQFLSCRVRLEKELGKANEARKLLDDFVASNRAKLEQDQELGKARTCLAIGSLYSSLGDRARAVEEYRRLSELQPNAYILLVRELVAQGRINDAVTSCLDAQVAADVASPTAATVVAQLLSSTGADEQTRKRGERVIASALETNGENIDLLLAVAVLNVTRENNDQAIALFRRVVKLAPDHILALNNLATLLSEREQNHAEALEVINHALAIGKRQPALLDTLGTVQLRAGEASKAVATLEEATKGGAADPRCYFHLACAYARDDRAVEARKALEKARERQLDRVILTRGDRELLLELERETSVSGESGEQSPARTLAPAAGQSMLPPVAAHQGHGGSR